ncbi:glycosyltransferase family 4 protein [Phocaeicola barnesiae]|uniref:glycosyltransferase family 4 protein n=1 Tax=Phocaeicola barnesiae TaxID=376804 RepID=UPI0025A4B852|nr:glycosyltransferase [Phocaeicola barnesiae]MDM8310361.1 glycosyltransferase [Phocaeicola barnesiae]
MKVLWFEITIPANYKASNRVVSSWQDSLEAILKSNKEIELYIAFETTNKEDQAKTIDGVTYVPMITHYSFIEKKLNKITWKINENKIIKNGIQIIDKYKPDIIHVFGNEWPFGLLAKYTNIPLVIHIQGSIIPYYNALYPPKYNGYTLTYTAGLNLKMQWQNIKALYKNQSRLNMEKRIWECVNHYMGRTSWDKALVKMIHPNATYHHVDEAIRPIFLETNTQWKLSEQNQIQLFSTGCTTFWKGVDVMLKTAHILKTLNINFTWKVAGFMPKRLKAAVEKKEKLKFNDNNIEILGFISPTEIINLMSQSTIYVHTAYIENSPNSICEAQLLGMPIISTMVGGISTLVRNGIDGDLLPANDPWQIANAILELAKDKERMMLYSKNSKEFAVQRHDKQKILNQLLNCYNDIIEVYTKP